MNSLEQFLNLPDVDNIVKEIEVSDRLTKLVGKFKVKAMTAEEYKDYQRKAGGGAISKGKYELDTAKYFISMVAGQTVSPDFSNKEALEKNKCISAEQLVSKKLLMGEIISIAGKIQEISGFNINTDEEIKEAKN